MFRHKDFSAAPDVYDDHNADDDDRVFKKKSMRASILSRDIFCISYLYHPAAPDSEWWKNIQPEADDPHDSILTHLILWGLKE